MKTRVLVTGATGFTGSYVVPLLLQKGYQVRCLVRENSKREVLPLSEVELVYGDLDDQDALARVLRGMDVLVNIASLGFGHAPNIVGSAVAAGIRRSVFISTTAVNTSLNAPSKSVRLAAEELIRDSGLAHTILRPTMIFGSSRDRNICRLVRYLNRWPFIPVFGDGEHLQQPVYVADLAAAIVQSLATDTTIGQTYNISGKAPVTYNQLIDTICRLMGRKVRKIRVPAGPIVAGLSALERLPVRLPIKSEQIRRLNEDKAFDYETAARDFGYQPRSLDDGIRQELEEMGLARHSQAVN
jgi:nucleoside-diphosphate-sugar epimerase